MGNTILDHIEHVILEGRRPSPHGVRFEIATTADAERSTFDIQMKVRAELRVFFDQFISENAPPEHSQLVRQQAKAGIARHLYADVLTDLLACRDAFWEDGVMGGDAMEKLCALIDSLQGDMTRFKV